MLIALIVITIAFLTTQIFVPSVRTNRALAARRFEYEYRHMQLAAIKRYYSDLNNLSHREISNKYNVSQAYHRMGREHLHFDD